jgi:ArsR family transcriptional regulator, arsenate/arsenite/antimonite-responsive transcriptional repressor
MNTINESHALEIARALGDAVRFSIYRHIVEMEEVRCGDICVNSPVRASTVSHHLRMLAEAGLIESRREGQGVYYRWVPSKLEAYLKYLRKLAQKSRHRGPMQPIVMAIR